MDIKKRKEYTDVLIRELVPAFGCTEPIAVAYASSVARSILGEMPVQIIVRCSGDILKNAKGVIVPNTVSMRGIDVSAILGAVGGNPRKGLEVLDGITREDLEQTRMLLKENICKVEQMNSSLPLYIEVNAISQEHSAIVKITGEHTHISEIRRDGELLENMEERNESGEETYPVFTIKDILEYAKSVPLEDVASILRKQVKINWAIAEEGMKNDYGANVGKTLIKYFGDHVWTRARAYAAAASDARMSGCTLPVVINSGSGNQGISVSLPVVVYAQHCGIEEERMLRALIVSNLTAIYQKSQLGRLSAFCGAVCAACGSGAGIAWMLGGELSVVERTITNTLVNVGGMICDGAKPSCAAKISSAVEAALSAYYMAIDNQEFSKGEGLAKADCDSTVRCIMCMGREGMRQTDEKILELMME